MQILRVLQMDKALSGGKKLHIGYLVPSARDERAAFARWRSLSSCRSRACETFWYADQEGFDRGDAAGNWREIAGMQPLAAAQVIRRDRVQLLVDLSGYAHRRFWQILELKPAPLQAVFVGAFDTTRLAAVQYMFTDRYCDPSDPEQPYFTESLRRLPAGHFCYAPAVAAAAPRRSPFKEKGYVTYACFRRFERVENSFLTLWGRILQAVPQSRLLVQSRIFSSGYSCQETRHRLRSLGFPEDRVDFLSGKPGERALYDDVDIMLDTYPEQGGSDTCEALFCGVPVVTLTGRRHGARLGYSLLKNIGLIECIAFAPEEYVSKAAALGSNPYKLAQLRRGLRERMQKSPLMDGRRYVACVEREYAQLWEEYADSERRQVFAARAAAVTDTVAEGLLYVERHAGDAGEQTADEILAEAESAFRRIRDVVGGMKDGAVYQRELLLLLKGVCALRELTARREQRKASALLREELLPRLENFKNRLRREASREAPKVR